MHSRMNATWSIHTYRKSGDAAAVLLLCCWMMLTAAFLNCSVEYFVSFSAGVVLESAADEWLGGA